MYEKSFMHQGYDVNIFKIYNLAGAQYKFEIDGCDLDEPIVSENPYPSVEACAAGATCHIDEALAE